jgi:hypothetical protein
VGQLFYRKEGYRSLFSSNKRTSYCQQELDKTDYGTGMQLRTLEQLFILSQMHIKIVYHSRRWITHLTGHAASQPASQPASGSWQGSITALLVTTTTSPSEVIKMFYYRLKYNSNNKKVEQTRLAY